jgi:hypothetical protein
MKSIGIWVLMALAKGIPFGCFHNMRFFWASIKATTKLWFAWLDYNIIDIVFMIFGIFIKIVEFVMARELAPSLTMFLLSSSTSLSKTTFFHHHVKYSFIESTHTKGFCFLFCGVSYVKLHPHVSPFHLARSHYSKLRLS